MTQKAVWRDSGRFVGFQAKNKMKKCRRSFAHLQISLWKSSLSLKNLLLCLRPPFNKLWEKLNFKFDHFLWKMFISLEQIPWQLPYSVFWWSLQLFPAFWLRYLSWYTIAYFNQHLLNIYFMPASWYIYEANKNECITTYSPSSKRYQYSRCWTEMDSIAIQQISCSPCL